MSLLRRVQPDITFNRHFDDDGTTVFMHACVLGCEGIVSKRLGSTQNLLRASGGHNR
jgi:ATP-dependent DNA ligase